MFSLGLKIFFSDRINLHFNILQINLTYHFYNKNYGGLGYFNLHVHYTHALNFWKQPDQVGSIHCFKWLILSWNAYKIFFMWIICAAIMIQIVWNAEPNNKKHGNWSEFIFHMKIIWYKIRKKCYNFFAIKELGWIFKLIGLSYFQTDQSLKFKLRVYKFKSKLNINLL